MPTIYTNKADVPLSMGVWLIDDDYDYNDDPYTISATTLLKPIKAIVLARQNSNLTKTGDIQSLVASRIGTAIHDAIEKSWRKPGLTNLLQQLGLPKTIADKVIVDPTTEEVKEGCVPVYMERRSHKKVGKYTISGKFDFVIEGHLEDFKSTGTYTYEKKTNDKKYAQQGSLYRWLNPDIIEDDVMTICYIFTNWAGGMAYKDGYPSYKTMGTNFVLETIDNTQLFVESKIKEIDNLMPLSQDHMPICTREDLWQGVGVWKYYKVKGAKRSTKNFDTPVEAQARLIKDGSVGEVIHIPDEAKACTYCDVNQICIQGINNLAK